jgi:hypothetical protein
MQTGSDPERDQRSAIPPKARALFAGLRSPAVRKTEASISPRIRTTLRLASGHIVSMSMMSAQS